MILIIKYSINKISLYMCGRFAKVSKCTGVTYPEKNIIKIIVEVTFIYLVSNAKSFLLPQIFEIDFIKVNSGNIKINIVRRIFLKLKTMYIVARIDIKNNIVTLYWCILSNFSFSCIFVFVCKLSKYSISKKFVINGILTINSNM